MEDPRIISTQFNSPKMPYYNVLVNTQNMTLVRAIERNDYKVLDNEAYTNLKMVIDDASVKGEE